MLSFLFCRRNPPRIRCQSHQTDLSLQRPCEPDFVDGIFSIPMRVCSFQLDQVSCLVASCLSPQYYRGCIPGNKLHVWPQQQAKLGHKSPQKTLDITLTMPQATVIYRFSVGDGGGGELAFFCTPYSACLINW